MSKPKIGITIGDVNGIGPEVIIKTLANESILQSCTPIIYGCPKVLSYHKNIAGVDTFSFSSIGSAEEARPGRVNVVKAWAEDVEIDLGQATEASGKFAYLALEKAVAEMKENLIDGLVTAPINKQAMEQANFTDMGHTEYLARHFGPAPHQMLMVSDTLRVGLVTVHVPLASVTSLLDKERVSMSIEILHNTLKVDFGLERPVIAVLGLNPHAGDGGLIGTEDDEIIRPAIIESKKSGIAVAGPFAADGFFGSGAFRKVDAVLAMYHDQGLIPFKALSFGHGVNYTAGLPIIRTSPDHGVGYDIAGKGVADPGSFRHAVFLALDTIRQRQQHTEWHANPLPKRERTRRPQRD